MKNISLYFRYAFLFLILLFQCSDSVSAQVKTSEEGYQYFEMPSGDSTIVMREYFMCFLIRGETTSQDKEEAAKIQTGHLAHLAKLHEDGKACLAGPFGDDGSMRGIVVYTVNTIEEAEKLANMDPAVKAGRLKVEIHPWWAMQGAVMK